LFFCFIEHRCEDGARDTHSRRHLHVAAVAVELHSSCGAGERGKGQFVDDRGDRIGVGFRQLAQFRLERSEQILSDAAGRLGREFAQGVGAGPRHAGGVELVIPRGLGQRIFQRRLKFAQCIVTRSIPFLLSPLDTRLEQPRHDGLAATVHEEILYRIAQWEIVSQAAEHAFVVAEIEQGNRLIYRSSQRSPHKSGDRGRDPGNGELPAWNLFYIYAGVG
jgi:hypothetical protein